MVVNPDPPRYIGGPCPDPKRCLYWRRFASGPWTCEANHPREKPAT